VRATTVLSGLGAGLRRNVTMFATVVVVTAISLLFLGTALLVDKQVDLVKSYWYDKVEVSVFLCGADSEAPTCSGEVTPEQRAALERDLRLLPVVQDVIYESKEEAFGHFQDYYRDSAIAENVTVDQMPQSFRVKLEDPERFRDVFDAFAGREGVELVQDEKELFESLFDVLGKLQLGALVLAGVQALVAVTLISATIRVAAFNRRRETGIMRLVGASSFSIQLPFVLEGALAGLLGALLAIGGLAAIQHFLVLGWAAPNVPQLTNYVQWSDVYPIMGIMLVVGVALAAVASSVTLLRYLRV
jgi:cell division transport system permease protein